MRNGQTPYAEWQKQQRAKHKAARDAATDPKAILTPDEYEKYEILRYCGKAFDCAKRARKPHETYDVAWALFNGDMWNDRRPSWRATITINKIRAYITFIQAIMTDNKPRFSVEPIVPGSEDAADLLRKLSDRDWDENNMQQIVSLWVLYGLIWGYAFVKVTYDPYANNGRGKHLATVIPPYRIYTNQSATCVEDAEYIIHVEDMTMGWVRRNFPQKAALVNSVRTADRHDDSNELKNRDYVRDGIMRPAQITSALNINGNIVPPQINQLYPGYYDDDQDTVEIAEYWMRDDSLEKYQRQKVKNGKYAYAPVISDGAVVMEEDGTQQIRSDLDGSMITVPKRKPKMAPVMEEAWRRKYPNGRVIVIAAGRVLLRDIPNPFQIDGFPFAMWKDYDVGGIHGQGEPLQLRSMAIAANKIPSQIYEILEKTGNPSWKVKKGGVNLFSVKNKPGLVIPMENIQDMAPLEKPPMPQEFFELYKLIVGGMEEVSGVNESVRGALPAANTAFATMDQLQESGSAPIRLKVRNLEAGITRYGKIRLQLIQQFDQGDRPLRVSEENFAEGVVQPASSVSVQFKEYRNLDLQGQVEFGVIPISSLSTSPQGLWNRWMKLKEVGLVDDIWWHEKFRLEGWKSQLPRMLKQREEDAKKEAAAKAASKAKPGPAPRNQARSAAQSRRAPASTMPGREANAMVR